MAITPRTILTSAAPATVAVVSLYVFTVLGTTAFTCLTNSEDSGDEPQPDTQEISSVDALLQHNGCSHVAERFGEDTEQWSEFAWVNLGHCFDDLDKSRLVVDTATLGLEQYPESEILYNMKGYHQIVLEEHATAIETLQQGMDEVSHHRNGVMANNLAWAGLFEPRKMELEEMRELYNESLALSPGVCETLHTGLFVEFAIADRADGLDQVEPRRKFAELRNDYERCLDRLSNGDRKTVAEILGAAVIFAEMDNHSRDARRLMDAATTKLAEDFDDVSADTICEEAMPLADHHHACVDAVERSMQTNRQGAVLDVRDSQQVREVRTRVVIQPGEEEPVIHQRTERSVSSGCGGILD